MQRSFALFALCVWDALAGSVPIATFDGAEGTSLAWQPVNDPVMGGQSTSSFKVDGGRHLGVWTGEVKIVPFLKAPGFCNLQSPGLGKVASFPDLSSSDGIVVRAREVAAAGLVNFNIQVMSKGAKRLFQQGVYTANLSVTSEMADHFVPWSAFVCTLRGEKVSWCPQLTTQLKEINSVGLGTAFPGRAGAFSIEIESLIAKASSAAAAAAAAPAAAASAAAAAAYIDLATFDGKAAHKWHAENDPVMGGQSSSTLKQMVAYEDFSGTTRIVPALKAPGFTIAMTEGFPFLSRFPDVSSMDGLTISVRNEANYTGYKLAFCDSHINPYRCQFGSFKADLVVASNVLHFQDIFIPWSKFSDKWDAATGKHTAENPPTAASLKSISQLQIWTEGVEGNFHLQFQYVRASKAPETTIVV